MLILGKGVAPSAPAAAPSVTRVQITDAPTSVSDQDGPTWYLANHDIVCPWVNPGGDWRDANNISQGTNHYAVSAAFSTTGNKTLNVSTLVTRLLIENTGIYLSASSGGYRMDPGPTLHIMTTAGTFDPPCIVDTYLDPSAGVLGDRTNLYSPAILLKFDLSGVRGSVLSAVLTISINGVGEPTIACADYLDTPSLALAGPVELGVAAAQTNATLGSNPSVLIADNLVSKAYISSHFTGIPAARPNLTSDVDMITWPQYGLGAARCWCWPQSTWAPYGGGGSADGNQRILSWHHWGEPELGESWQLPYRSGYDHLFFRYLFLVGEDLPNGYNERGMKCPGLAGTYDYSGSGATTTPPPSDFSTWSARTWYTPLSAANPGRYRLGMYYYGVEAPIEIFGGSGNPSGPMFGTGYLNAGQVHCIEQEVWLNTMAADSTSAQFAYYTTPTAETRAAAWAEVIANANPDGVLRLWLDGVKVFERTNVRIRGNYNARIQSIPFVDLYHGGLNKPSGLFHHEIGGLAISTAYIGPPNLEG